MSEGRDDSSTIWPTSVPEKIETATCSLSERDAALCLHLVNGLGPRAFSKLIEHFGSAVNVLAASPASLRDVPGISLKLARSIALCQSDSDFQLQLKICQENSISVLDPSSEEFPASLKEIHDPPPILFAQGNFQDQDQLAIAIVGSRHATHYGLRTAERLATQLSMLGFTIVSGLARGIDAAAHRGALTAGGRTIAVLGGGLLNIYPSEHAELASKIREQGMVMSESLPLAAPKSGSFPSRNRMISGLSLGVIIVEAAQRSGALITARLAAEQGREVFAVPGQIDSRMSRGCHQLIRDGAKLVESADDVLEELGPLALPAKISADNTVRKPAELKLDEQERQILNAISANGTGFDELIVATGLPAPRVLATISILEVRGLIKRRSGTQFARV